MSADTATTFLQQNGAFGVLVALIVIFVWKGIPWIAGRYEALHKQYGDELKRIAEGSEKVAQSHEKAMGVVTETLAEIRDDLRELRANHAEIIRRLTDLETQHRGRHDLARNRGDHLEGSGTPYQ